MTALKPAGKGTARSTPRAGARRPLPPSGARRATAEPWLPAAVAAVPLLLQALRAVFSGGQLYLWGDQALIDLEARSTLMGHNLVGVYDRYGWHHLGPTWLGLLGVARWLGGGSGLSVVVGAYLLQALFVAAIVLVVNRLRPGRTAWWAAVIVVAYEWSFGLDRLGTVWAPYAVALPAALLVLIVADLASNPAPWPAAAAMVACASFLCQTEISTIVLTAVLVLTAPLLRFGVQRFPPAARLVGARAAPAGRGGEAPADGGWRAPGWRVGASAVAGVAALLWSAPLVQQVSGRPGNLTALSRFFSGHSGHQTLGHAVAAVDTVLGSFPFRTGVQNGHHDADVGWLVSPSPWSHPWYLLYLLGVAGVLAVALKKRDPQAFAVAAATGAALLAVGLSVPMVYGPLYPYLVFWAGALVVPFWVGTSMAFAGSGQRLRAAAGQAARGAKKAPPGALWRRWATVPGAAVALALVVGAVFVVYPAPMTGKPSQLGRNAWRAVASAVKGAGVKEVYIDLATTEAMPDAAAIADQAVREGRRVEVDAAALHYFDPSFALSSPPQLEVLVCCGKHVRALAGFVWRGRVGGQEIYAGRWVTVDGVSRAPGTRGWRAQVPGPHLPATARPTPAAPPPSARARHEV